MEEYVFAGNRRRWKYVRPVIGTAAVAAGLWFASLCWVLLESPALPDLGLGMPRATMVARIGASPARGLQPTHRWALR